MPTIETERLCLRRWLPSDTASFAAMNSDPDVMKHFPRINTTEETTAMIKRINAHFDTHGFGLFAVEIKATGNFIGFTGLAVPTFESFFTPCVEIGWRYQKEVWGNGFAGEAARACLHYGFTRLKLKRIVSFTSAINKPSEKLMQRIGMTLAGHFNHPYIDKSSPLCRHVLYEIAAPGEPAIFRLPWVGLSQ